MKQFVKGKVDLSTFVRNKVVHCLYDPDFNSLHGFFYDLWTVDS
jgi:hypothetical protein